MTRGERLHDWLLAGSIMALGLLLRLTYLDQYAASPLFCQIIGPDVAEYSGWAGRILAGQWFWTKVDIHAPLYPYYLALLYWLGGMAFYVTRLVQMLVVLAAFLPLFFALRRYYRRDVWYWLPPLYLTLASVYTPLIFYSGELLSEALMVPLLALGIAGLYFGDRTKKRWRYGWYAGAGLALGLAGITHPLALATGLAGGLVLVWRARRVGRRLDLAIFLLAAFLPIVVVCGYNSRLEKTFVPVQKNSGYNLYLGNNPAATGGCYIWPGPVWDKVHGEANCAAQKLGITKDQYFFRQVKTFIAEQPVVWLTLVGHKALYTWNHIEAAAGPDLPKLKYFTPLLAMTDWLPGVVMMVALAGLLLLMATRARRDWWRGRYLLLTLLGGWLLLALTVVGGRYRLMMLPGVFFTASWMLIYLAARNGRRRWLLTEAMLLLAAMVVWLPRMKIDGAVERIQADTILGEAYLNAGQREKALDYLKSAEQGMSRWSRSYNLLGRYYEATRPDLAEHYYRQAIDCAPEEAYGYMNLGNMASRRNDASAAEKWFAAALQRGADNPQVLYNVGYFMLHRGKRDSARQLLEKCVELKPDDRRALNGLAVIALLDNRPQIAIGYLQTALRLEPRNIGVMVNLAAASWAAGDRNSARQWLKQALQLDPKHVGALELQRRLVLP